MDTHAGTAASALAVLHLVAFGDKSVKWIGSEKDEPVFCAAVKRLHVYFRERIVARSKFHLWSELFYFVCVRF